MKTLQRLTLLLLVGIQSVGFTQTTHIDNVSNKYHPLLKEQNKGIALLVKKENKIETASLGNFELTASSVFNIGSATKTFTAILILQELEKGNLRLEDPIENYLTPIDNVNSSLTIEALLTHESGLDEVIGKNIEEIFYAKNDSLYEANLLSQVEKNDPDKIGSFDYCNTNYFLLGKILEKITDQSYFDLLRERIFKPLEMKNTYPYVHKNLPNLATPYHQEEDVTEYLDYRYFATIVYAAGSIASTLSDMELFYTALYESEILLKNETLQLMLQSGNNTYGLGIFKYDRDGTIHYGHGGNNIGYAFRNEYNPKTKNLFLLFTNSMKVPLYGSIKNDLEAYYKNKTVENFKSVDIENFKKYAGNYLLKEANLELTIVQEENKLYLVVDSQRVKSMLMQKSEKTIYDTTVGATLTIIEGDDNSLTFSQNGFSTTISKIITEDSPTAQN